MSVLYASHFPGATSGEPGPPAPSFKSGYVYSQIFLYTEYEPSHEREYIPLT